jgi:hypothetical protein
MLYAQTPTQQHKFALEISEDGPPLHYELVPQGELVRGELLSIAPSPYLHLRSGRTTADAKKDLASAFMLAYHVDGDAVAITASVVFGAFDNNSGSDPMKADHPKQDIGTYSLHPNESVVLQEMEQFGLQPWTIKIVNAQLPTSAGLPTINEVPSIQSKILGQDRQGYTMALHNLSSRAVSAFVVETTLDHNSTSSEFNYRGSLIAPNEIHEFRLFCDTSASAVDQSPCAFILKAPCSPMAPMKVTRLPPRPWPFLKSQTRFCAGTSTDLSTRSSLTLLRTMPQSSPAFAPNCQNSTKNRIPPSLSRFSSASPAFHAPHWIP